MSAQNDDNKQFCTCDQKKHLQRQLQWQPSLFPRAKRPKAGINKQRQTLPRQTKSQQDLPNKTTTHNQCITQAHTHGTK